MLRPHAGMAAACDMLCSCPPCCPQGFDPRQGLPKVRSDWVAAREARGDSVCTQASLA